MTNKSKHEFVFLTRTNITSERPTVDTHKMMAMVTSARSGKRKETTISWGACCRNRVGGAETAAWEALLEMNKIGFKARQEAERGMSLVVESAIAFGNVQLAVVFAVVHHLLVPAKDFACAIRG